MDFGLEDVGGKLKQGKRAAIKSKKDDRLFQRQMKLLKKRAETDECVIKPEIQKFMQKYKNALSNTLKGDLRRIWKQANCDFELAGAILEAKITAFKEKFTEGHLQSCTASISNILQSCTVLTFNKKTKMAYQTKCSNASRFSFREGSAPPSAGKGW